MGERVLSFEEALGVVLSRAREAQLGRATETVGIMDAPGRVLAVAVVADRDQPAFRRATRGMGMRCGRRILGGRCGWWGRCGRESIGRERWFGRVRQWRS